MFDLGNIVRKNVLDLKAYSSAREEFTGNASVWLDANENPYPNGLNRYPDPHQLLLKEKIAVLKETRVENIFLGNGSDEVIDLLFRAFCEPGLDKALLFTPTYGMYQVCADLNGVQTLKIPLNENFQIEFDQVQFMLNEKSLKLIFICSPNNPTGNLIDKKTIRKIANEFHGLVIIDEAYADFAPEGSMLPELENMSNLVVIQTFSKAWGMAGIRLGMAFASKDIVDVLKKIKPPYNVNSLTQQAALDAFQRTEQVKVYINEILSQKLKVKEKLEQLKIVREVFPSDANFLLVRFDDPKGIYNRLAENGIIVRDRTSAVRDCLRITIGTPEENKKLLTILHAINHEKNPIY